MKMGTGIDYFRSLSLFDLLQTVKDFVDVMDGINEAIKKAIKELQTCIPAIVKEVKSRNQVIVSPAIQKTSPAWQALPWADIVLPVYAPQGGDGIISMPVSAGDTGWIIAGDLDPSLYFQNPSKPATQNVFDRHNYQYGFFLPCNSYTPQKVLDMKKEVFPPLLLNHLVNDYSPKILDTFSWSYSPLT